MRFWGRGRFVHLTGEIRDPRAASYSKRLERACGCRLAWHRKRGRYIVYRSRGDRVAPITYLDVGGPGHGWPPLHLTVGMVKWADATRNADFDRLLRLADQRMATKSEEETEKYVDDWFPEYYNDLRRFHQLLRDGRISTRIFDMAGSR